MTTPRAQRSAEPQQATPEARLRDIDYAAVAVKKAIEEKFTRANDLAGLGVTATFRFNSSTQQNIATRLRRQQQERSSLSMTE